RERYAPFLRVIRDARPHTPILCITPIFSVGERHSVASRDRLGAMRQVIRDAVAERQQGRDERITLVEGYDLLGPDGGEGFVDGSHPNDLGFQSMANGLAPVLGRILGLAGN